MKNFILDLFDNDKVMFDHDLNITFLDKADLIKLKGLVSSNYEISKFLTLMICTFEGSGFDDDILKMNEAEYYEHLASCDIDKAMDLELVNEFKMMNFLN